MTDRRRVSGARPLSNSTPIYVLDGTAHIGFHDGIQSPNWRALTLVQTVVYGQQLTWCGVCFPGGRPR